MRMTLSSFFLLVIPAILGATGCGSSASEGEADAAVGPGGFSCSDKPSTLSGDVLPILMQ